MKTENKHQHENWYIPLKPHYSEIDSPMEMERFAKVEALFYLFLEVNRKYDNSDLDLLKLPLLLTNQHIIGAGSCTAIDYMLQQASRNLNEFHNLLYWKSSLDEYCNPKYDGIRAFIVSQNKIEVSSKNYPYPYEERKKEWARCWQEQPRDISVPQYASNGIYTYQYEGKDSDEDKVTVSVNFDSFPLPQLPSCTLPETHTKKYKKPIRIPVAELLECAKEMNDIDPKDYCYSVLKSNKLLGCTKDSVRTAKILNIKEVVNIVGMVGSGKSTLIKVLAYWFHKNGHRLVIVVNTVAEVLNLFEYLSRFDINASPLIGRDMRVKYINQIAEEEKTCLSPKLSSILTPSCIISGMDSSNKESIPFGKEPCYRLTKNKKKYLCPFFDHCSATKMLRDCYTASVVITTTAGFAQSRVGWNHELFLHSALNDFDLVIFDESDLAQKTLDEIFMPDMCFSEYIRKQAEQMQKYVSRPHNERSEAENRYYQLLLPADSKLDRIVSTLNNMSGDWKNLSNGATFSPPALLEDLYQNQAPYQIPDIVYQDIKRQINLNINPNTELDMAIRLSCDDKADIYTYHYNQWIRSLHISRPEKEEDIYIQDERIKLILQSIYLERLMHNLDITYKEMYQELPKQSELFLFLQNRYRDQQLILPSSFCGNVFGMKKTEDDDLAIFRQYAFGRSLMKDLPYLSLDQKGKPCGPHVMMMSGSSWAENSYEYHINRPVTYILETEKEKRQFLEKIEFKELCFPIKVSGSSEKNKPNELHQLVLKVIPQVIEEYKRGAGKILLIVNSYKQTEIVQKTLKSYLDKNKFQIRVCRMISDPEQDTEYSEQIPNTIQRGKIYRFSSMEDQILIAPAKAIERGHNIVDEQGHSALSSVFFLVRPLGKPDELHSLCGKLNGYIESNYCKKPQESQYSYHVRLRNESVKKWNMMNSQKTFGISDMDRDEQRDLVATLFILILQILGRLSRVTDPSKPAPHVYFVDGAFRRNEDRPDDFDCINSLIQYLTELMNKKEYAGVAQTLYGPFYKALIHSFPDDI